MCNHLFVEILVRISREKLFGIIGGNSHLIRINKNDVLWENHLSRYCNLDIF